jgi:hypothetical protein
MAAMNRTISLRAGVFAVTLAAIVVGPVPGYAQTPGMDRRQDRRQDRGDARDTRQTGRQTGRDAKAACRDAGGNPVECRQQKRAMKQDARGAARDVKTHD